MCILKVHLYFPLINIFIFSLSFVVVLGVAGDLYEDRQQESWRARFTRGTFQRSLRTAAMWISVMMMRRTVQRRPLAQTLRRPGWTHAPSSTTGGCCYPSCPASYWYSASLEKCKSQNRVFTHLMQAAVKSSQIINCLIPECKQLDNIGEIFQLKACLVNN